jgi:hypothetical protein
MAKMLIRKSQVSGLESELAALVAEDLALGAAIVAEETRALGAEAALQAAVDAEKLRAEAAELVLTNDLAAEVVRAMAAEGVLTSNLSAEVSRAQGEEGRIEGKLDQEILDRAADVTAEETRALAAEAAIASDLAAEVIRATGAEGGLQTQIDFITSNVDPAAIDSLTEIVAEFQAADGNLQTSITNLTNTAAADRTAIRNERDTEDARLQGEIDALETASTTRFDNLVESKQMLAGWSAHSDGSGRQVAGPFPFLTGVVMGYSVHCNGLRMEEGSGKDFEIEMDNVNNQYKVVVSADYSDEIAGPDSYGHNSSFVFRAFHG